jgi:hypothetical protein
MLRTNGLSQGSILSLGQYHLLAINPINTKSIRIANAVNTLNISHSQILWLWKSEAVVKASHGGKLRG